MTKYFIAGGAGFIGSHLCRSILKDEPDAEITVYDNFSSGQMWHLDDIKDNLKIVKADIKDKDALLNAIRGNDVVYHFASNPDIAKAMTQPDIDFWEGTYLTNNIIEAMRISGVMNLLYASGSGVYGDAGFTEASEDYSPQLPISTYGSSKLACEAMLCSYCYMFDMNAAAFRFANVVGPNQTHGVGYDFTKKLLDDNSKLTILGDGSQSKSYIYVTDIINAIRNIQQSFLKGYSYYNVSTLDYISVKEIADITTAVLNLENVKYEFTGGNRGWKGDVPVVRLNSEKIRSTGWTNEYTSAEAIRKSVESIYDDALKNKFGWKGETA
ncbi:MAG TPA: NAD-dependent epimerase/dehydratase family protein [Ignavibacteria bacterium]|nr:NAD-dependent dehydratase [Bacteroidota bacterium]HRI84115.1 NAD-dependent epimerase/dehydratase family protein [Ignavibacteria bacterium]HRJ98097.1 NAD-dependent epimerase/dehydratase family protein [Ignavibacteria bacterium]